MKKKILIIGPGMELGGVERSLIGLLDAFDYSQVDVDLFLFSHSGELMTHLNPNAKLLPEPKYYSLIIRSIGTLFRQGHFLVGIVRVFSKFYGLLRKRFIVKKNAVTVARECCYRILTGFEKKLNDHYDMALGFFLPHYFLNSKVDADIKIGWVHTDYGSSNERPDVAYLQPMWEKLDYIACVSDSVKKSFGMVYPKLHEKLIVVENVLSLNYVKTLAKEQIPPDEMPMDKFAILSVGRFATQKNFLAAIKCAKRLYDEGLEFRWFFIGYGPLEDKMHSLVAELQAEEYVRILGKKVNPYPYMLRCNLYVQPSLYEGKAVTVREAQMLARPVLITNFATSLSQLENGVDGHVCELSFAGICDGVKYMMEHPDYMAKLATNATKRDYSGSEAVQTFYEDCKPHR